MYFYDTKIFQHKICGDKVFFRINGYNLKQNEDDIIDKHIVN